MLTRTEAAARDEGTTPDERALVASLEWSRAKQAMHFAISVADRERADAERAAALLLYRQARRDARASRERE
jgi:hypothetical protein